ncbi:hypothetical protein BH20PSE1_BH20PSE1_02990 [soil metagenome]
MFRLIPYWKRLRVEKTTEDEVHFRSFLGCVVYQRKALKDSEHSWVLQSNGSVVAWARAAVAIREV